MSDELVRRGWETGAMAALSGREKRVLLLRFRLPGEEVPAQQRSRAKVATDLGLTVYRLIQIESDALLKLQGAVSLMEFLNKCLNTASKEGAPPYA